MQHGFARGGVGGVCGPIPKSDASRSSPARGRWCRRRRRGRTTQQTFHMPPPPSGKRQPPPPCGGGSSASLSSIEDHPAKAATPHCHHPGEGRGPVGKVVVTKRSPQLATSPNWTPAFAGVVPLEWLGFVRNDRVGAFTAAKHRSSSPTDVNPYPRNQPRLDKRRARHRRAGARHPPVHRHPMRRIDRRRV